jgi:hypothetical protein
MALTAPSLPVITVVNSDTLSVAVSGIDGSATHVAVQIKKATDTTYVTADTILVGALPLIITNLLPNTEYNIRALSVSSTETSTPSTVANATTKTLYVYGLITELGAVGETGVDVQLWRNPVLPDHTVGDHLDYRSNQSFDGSPVNISGVDYARIRVSLPTQPPDGVKLRNDDTVWMVCRKVVTGNARWTPLLSGIRAKVVEV